MVPTFAPFLPKIFIANQISSKLDIFNNINMIPIIFCCPGISISLTCLSKSLWLEDSPSYVTGMNLNLKLSCWRNIQLFIFLNWIKTDPKSKPRGPVRYSTLIILQTFPLPVLAPSPKSNGDLWATCSPNAPPCHSLVEVETQGIFSKPGNHVLQVWRHLQSCQIPGKLLPNSVLISHASKTTLRVWKSQK